MRALTLTLAQSQSQASMVLPVPMKTPPLAMATAARVLPELIRVVITTVPDAMETAVHARIYDADVRARSMVVL